MIMTALIITPLLGFVINMMDTDRKEQAKATTEQEIQAALDYIARDLDQAFFIYDGFGLNRIRNNLPKVGDDPNQDATGEPVLVFWKRKFLPNSLPIPGATGDCLNNDPNNNCDDGFVYSLVGYYITKQDNCATSAWSCTRQIRRIELKDALSNVNGNGLPVPGYDASPGIGSVADLLEERGTLEDKLNSWAGGGYNYSVTPFQTLIDYVDQTDVAVDQPNCSEAPRPGEANAYLNRQVPEPGTVDTDSFYACVNSDQTIAQVYIRGNALARIRPKNQVPVYADNLKAYFPRANIQAQGSGLLNVNPSQ
jgi:hypothetical protein